MTRARRSKDDLAEHRKAMAYQKAERHRLVRMMLVDCVEEGEIVQHLTIGIEHPVLKVIRVSETTARRDIKEVGEEFAGLFTSEDAMEREIAGAFSRLKRIAVKAETAARPNYPAAITANMQIIKIASSKSSRWRHLYNPRAAPVDQPEETDPSDTEGLDLAAELEELAGMSDEELRKRSAKLQEKMEAMGLSVHETERAPATAAKG